MTGLTPHLHQGRYEKLNKAAIRYDRKLLIKLSSVIAATSAAKPRHHPGQI